MTLRIGQVLTISTAKDKLVKDYMSFVAPKIIQNKPLSELDIAVKTAVECMQKGDKKGYKSANELIGRLISKKSV